MTRPHENDPCIQCHRAGHFCQAMLIVMEEALCFECADDEPCAFAKMRASLQRTPAPVQTVAGEKEKDVRRPFSTTPIAQEIKDAIAKEDPSLPHKELALKYGVSDVSVISIRKKAGVWKKRPKGGRIPRRAAAALNKPLTPPKPAEVQPVEVNRRAAAVVTVPLDLTEDLCIAIFSRLPLDQKGRALGSVLQSVLA